tara:strand:- start:42 stop:488 length:447 start_codon:yes stop_codon:yes gene_type:complete
MTDINTLIAAATSLDDLADILNSHPSLDELGDGEPRLDEVADLAGLPTFGGTEPADTSGIWSWDETRLLVTGGDESFSIEERGEREDPDIAHYTVDIDAVTGEWILDTLTETGIVDRADHDALIDTDTHHYDTWEHDGETCAVSCRFV